MHMDQKHINARGIIFENGKLLAQKLVPDHHGNARDFWCTPGGGLEKNESILSALEREVIEETGVKPQIGRLLFIQQFFDGDRENVEFFFHITNSADFHNIDLASTANGAKETEKIEFVNPKETLILPSFLSEVNIQEYIDNKPDVLIVNNLS